MSNIYVVGHRNPDTDSIVSAMAYAALRNATGDREYEAARLDHCNDETKRVLKKFGFEQPTRIVDVKTQVKDLAFDTPPTVDPAVPLHTAWNKLREGHYSTLPVINTDGTLFGTLSSGDIANYNMATVDSTRVTDLPLFNLLGVIEGRIISEGDAISGNISGEILVAVPGTEYSKDSILLCGNQPELIEEAINKGVNALILCGVSANQDFLANSKSTCVIYTPFDCATVVKRIFPAMPVSVSCTTEGIICFHLDDYVEEIKEKTTKSRFRCYPILDENNKVVGTLSRTHLLRPNHKRVVLVDHNESAQAVPGLEQAEILQIIDHHRLADIQTMQPIHMRNEPVGSTTTIVATMYQENGVMPTKEMAGLMVAAILSDTVVFKSPTCTKRDIAMAERMAKIAGLSVDEISKVLFENSGGSEKSANELIKADFKEFHIAEHKLGVGQITCADSTGYLARKDEFITAMKELAKVNQYDFVLLAITDVLKEGSYILYLGDEETIKYAFSADANDHEVYLPGVMSRKKQIIPMMTALWG